MLPFFFFLIILFFLFECVSFFFLLFFLFDCVSFDKHPAMKAESMILSGEFRRGPKGGEGGPKWGKACVRAPKSHHEGGTTGQPWGHLGDKELLSEKLVDPAWPQSSRATAQG